MFVDKSGWYLVLLNMLILNYFNKMLKFVSKKEREVYYQAYMGSNELSPSGIWGKVDLRIIE